MSLLTRNSLPVIADAEPARAIVDCKPYRCKLSLEACAKRYKLATADRSGNLTATNNLCQSSCRTCPVGLNTSQVMRRHGLKIATRRVRYGTLYA